MADFTPILDDELLPDAPIPSLIGFRFRDNPQAMFEGAPDAPRQRIGALQRLTAGDEIRSRYDPEQNVSASGAPASVTSLEFAFLQAGTVRVSFEHRGVSGSGGSTGAGSVQRTRGRVVTTVATYANTGSYTARVVDVPVLPGDRLEVTSSVGGTTGTNQAGLRNARISTGGEDLYPGMPAPLEGNTYNA